MASSTCHLCLSRLLPSEHQSFKSVNLVSTLLVFELAVNSSHKLNVMSRRYGIPLDGFGSLPYRAGVLSKSARKLKENGQDSVDFAAGSSDVLLEVVDARSSSAPCSQKR